MSLKTWSEEDEKALIDMYTNRHMTDVKALGKHFNKGYRSVISKLVQLKIYIKPVIESEEKADSVKTMLIDLEKMLDISFETTNLNKKENLTMLMNALREKLKK